MSKPLATPAIYQNPFMAPNDFSEIHFNAYQTDTCSVQGPASAQYQSVQHKLIMPPGIAATLAFNAKGQLITIRIGHSSWESANPTIMLLEPDTLETLAECTLPRRPNTDSLSFAGGYFYLDQLGNVVCVTADQKIGIYSTDNDQIKLLNSWDLSEALKINSNPADILNSVLPDSLGNLWFISQAGVVGYVDSTNQAILATCVRNVSGANPAETISKSFASDANGNVYVVSDYALYCYQASASGPQNIWRTEYDRGSETKSGQNQQGSGTTPTCFDDFDGNQFVAITDNAAQMHVNVYSRGTGQMVAQQAVFTDYPSQNSCENSLIALNRSIIVENNYGNTSVKSTMGHNTTTPGVNRVDFDPATGKSEVVWANNSISVPSVVSQLSSGDGMVYTYAKDQNGWYWAALDFETGQLLTRSPTVEFVHQGDGLIDDTLANNYYAGLTIGPDGGAYLSVFGGIVVWRPRP